MNIKLNDLVLEVGSGNSPRWRSDIIADRLVHDDSQRAGEFKIVIDRPFVVADGYNLPFKDNAFDYVICSHVLEHMEYPEKFVKEVMRVGKRGYIEVPSILGERLFGWDFHLWYCEFEKNKLIMTKKKEGLRFQGFFHKLIAQSIWFRRFCEENEDKFYIKYEWNSKINLEIKRKEKTRDELKKVDYHLWQLMSTITWDIKKDFLFYCSWILMRIKRKSKKIFRKIVWNIKKVLKREKIINDWVSLCICPTCHKEYLENKDYSIYCTACNTKYNIDGVVPILLVGKEAKKGY